MRERENIDFHNLWLQMAHKNKPITLHLRRVNNLFCKWIAIGQGMQRNQTLRCCHTTLIWPIKENDNLPNIWTASSQYAPEQSQLWRAVVNNATRHATDIKHHQSNWFKLCLYLSTIDDEDDDFTLDVIMKLIHDWAQNHSQNSNYNLNTLDEIQIQKELLIQT